MGKMGIFSTQRLQRFQKKINRDFAPRDKAQTVHYYSLSLGLIQRKFFSHEKKFFA